MEFRHTDVVYLEKRSMPRQYFLSVLHQSRRESLLLAIMNSAPHVLVITISSSEAAYGLCNLVVASLIAVMSVTTSCGGDFNLPTNLVTLSTMARIVCYRFLMFSLSGQELIVTDDMKDNKFLVVLV